MKGMLKDPKNLFFFVLTFLSIIAIMSSNNLLFALKRFALFCIVALISDYSLGVYRKTKFNPLNSVSIAEILFLTASLYSPPFLIFLAIVSTFAAKNYLFFKGKLMVNPPAFGLFIASLFGLPISWWGILPGLIFSSLIILTTGFVSIYKQRQELIILPFILVIFGTTLFFTGNLFISYTQLLIGSFWFFSLVMLPDQECSPISKKLKFFYGVFVAFISILIPTVGIRIEPLITALLIGNITFWYIEKEKLTKKENFKKLHLD